MVTNYKNLTLHWFTLMGTRQTLSIVTNSFIWWYENILLITLFMTTRGMRVSALKIRNYSNKININSVSNLFARISEKLSNGPKCLIKKLSFGGSVWAVIHQWSWRHKFKSITWFFSLHLLQYFTLFKVNPTKNKRYSNKICSIILNWFLKLNAMLYWSIPKVMRWFQSNIQECCLTDLMSLRIKIMWDWLKYRTLNTIKWTLSSVLRRKINFRCYFKNILLGQQEWKILRTSLTVNRRMI